MKNLITQTIVFLLTFISMNNANAQEWIRLSSNDGAAINEKGIQPPLDPSFPERYFWENTLDICDMITQKMRENGRHGSCWMNYDFLKQGQRHFWAQQAYRVPAQTDEVYFVDNWVTEEEIVTQDKPRYEAEFGGSYERCRSCTLRGIIGNRICERGNNYCHQMVPVSVVNKKKVNKPVRKTRKVTTDVFEYSSACFTFNRDSGFELNECGMADPKGLGQYLIPFLKSAR